MYHINNTFPTVNNYHMSQLVQASLPLNLLSSPAHSPPPSLHSIHTLHLVIAQAHFSTTITTNRFTTTNPSPLSTSTTTTSFSTVPGSSTSLSKSTSQTRSLASWVDELRSQAASNLFQETILTYIKMLQASVYPDNFVFPAVLKAVAGLLDLDIGKQIHTHVVKFGYHSFQLPVANSLVNMYGKCNNMEDAYKVFERIADKDQVSWNSLIAALCRFEEWTLALEAFRLMLLEGVDSSSFTLVSMANACSNLNRQEGLRLGKEVHAHSLRKGDWMTFTINALMTMYARLDRLDESKILFELFQDRNIVSWNTIISSSSQNDQFMEALNLLRAMVTQGVKPDGITISSVLPSCSHLEMLNLGKEIHAYAIRNTDLVENPYVGSALIDMYCNCKQVDKGRQIFERSIQKTSALWNAMITGYAQYEFDDEALTLFLAMENANDIKPNNTTLSCVLPACARCEVFHDKEAIHGYIIKRGLVKDRYVQNALMDMYSRIGKIKISRLIFNGLEDRDFVSWNIMITGYAVCVHYEDALNLLHDMQIKEEEEEEERENSNSSHNGFILKPNSVTLMAVLPGCAALTALAKGKEIHAYAVRQMLAIDVAVGSALVDMYAKCGCLNIARKVFDQMPVRNMITWNILIMAYGMHGKGDEALELFNQMVLQEERNNDLRPNEVTYIAVFAACSHSGMVEKGLDLFHRMKDEHGVEPAADHYACIVDLLGRSGQVEKAYRLINAMPFGVNKTGAWCSLLGACRIHQNVDIGEIAAKQLFVLEPKVASHYVLLSNIYSSAGSWDKAVDVRKKMKEMGVKKEPGCSWFEFGDEVHKFLAGDMSHPQSKQLHEFLEQLSERMRKEGYIPDTSCVLHNLDDEEKAALLCGHSEKLAIAFGILNTPPGTTIRVAKNLRVCNDCHVATKFISKIMNREIILRDVRRFHHFRNGICSCGDYW